MHVQMLNKCLFKMIIHLNNQNKEFNDVETGSTNFLQIFSVIYETNLVQPTKEHKNYYISLSSMQKVTLCKIHKSS